MRGTGEGFRPFDLAPKSSMTNGNISARVDATTGPKLTVTYKGGEQTIVIDPKTPIVALAPGARTDLKPGAAIIARGPKQGDGSIDAAFVLVGKDGLVTPGARPCDLLDERPVLAVPILPRGHVFMRAWSRAIEAKPDSRATDSLFTFVLIKPTHYDDDGYPIQWFRSVMPSNTLACMFSLAEDARKREVLGPGVRIDVETYDETNRRVVPSRIIRDLKESGRALIGVVGAQSNQYPRSIDLAREFCAAGLQVCVGGFHVSGCIAMLPEMPEELKAAQAMGVSLFAGEAEEHRLDEVLLDAWRGELKPLYNFMDHLPSLEGEPAPILPRKHVVRTSGKYSSIDLGRGCPYQCSFCTIINVQGRKSRFRTPDDLEQIIRANKAQGINRFFITDDNFARNSDWEILLDRVIALKQEGIHVGFTIQVDTLCHKIPNFIEKATAAGVRRVFIGLENINPENLIAAKKRQNKITEYRVMLQKWRAHGALTYAGYILGFPADTKESILRDIEIIERELPLDILEFFFLTPLPGSEDHKRLHAKGVWMDPDINKYDLNHRVSHHAENDTTPNGRRLTARHGSLFIPSIISARSCGAPLTSRTDALSQS